MVFSLPNSGVLCEYNDIWFIMQHDPSISTSPVPGHVAPPFGRFPGPGLPPPIPPGAAPFAINAGTTMLPASAFSGDAYGVPGVPERPKKVPNI